MEVAMALGPPGTLRTLSTAQGAPLMVDSIWQSDTYDFD
jgi:hypothetical protein